MVYVAALSESQRVKLWRLIIEGFGPNIQKISGFDIIVDDIMSRLPSTSVNKYNHSTSKARCHVNRLFTIGRDENNEDCFPLNLLNVQR